MSDYISRDAAIEKIREAGCTDCGGSSGTICGFCDFGNAVRLVNGLPTADVEPVRHGQWLRTDDDWSSLVTIQCSACGGEWCFEIDEDVQLLGYNYCPGCGCKMDLEDETNDD